MASKKTSPAKTAKPKSSPKKAGPVARAWDIFNRNPKAGRKDAVATAVKAGINENTAKTQYQLWSHRRDKAA